MLPIELIIIGAFYWLNITGISLSGTTENILTTLKIIPLVIFSIPLNAHNFEPVTPITATGLLSTDIIVYRLFTGFEISATPVEETGIRRLSGGHFSLSWELLCLYMSSSMFRLSGVDTETLAASPAPVATAAGILF